MAVKKGNSASVKAYGTKRVADHTVANVQLKKIALFKVYSTSAPAMPACPLLANTKGTEFDKNYVAMMVADHKKQLPTSKIHQPMPNTLM